jgi:hypothetical protein
MSLAACVLLSLPLLGTGGPEEKAPERTGTVGAVPGAIPGEAFRPAGKSFKERLTAFLADAKATYGVTISRKAEFRKAEDAQKWHVAHMIAYNSFEGRKPARSEERDGRHLIAWSHLEDPATRWEHVRWEDYLRDKSGEVPVRKGEGWAPGHLPDEEWTRKQALAILRNAGVGTAKDRPREPNSAMVAPGYEGCAEPCRCGGARSKHIAGLASDLGSADLGKLEQKLKQADAGPLDAYLKRFGLHRPMSSEPWHVEATNP